MRNTHSATARLAVEACVAASWQPNNQPRWSVAMPIHKQIALGRLLDGRRKDLRTHQENLSNLIALGFAKVQTQPYHVADRGLGFADSSGPVFRIFHSHTSGQAVHVILRILIVRRGDDARRPVTEI